MRLKLWAAFAATSLVGITLIAAPDAKADRFGDSEENARKSAEKDKGKDAKSKDKDKDKRKRRAESASPFHPRA